ncbi:bifunctional RNase H/acid phosphatase [Streptomyces goshikiensis]
MAEYKGLIAGLKAARELAPDAQVLVRMDSKLVVEQMSGRWKIKHPDMKPLAAEAATVLPRSQVTYQWIPREQNKHADRLANEAMDAGKHGRQWEPSASTAVFDRGAARALATRRPRAPGRRRGRCRGRTGRPRLGLRYDGECGGVRPPPRPTPCSRPRVPVRRNPLRPRPPGPTAAPASGWGPDMGTPATFVLLRHGETALTPQKRFSGSGGTDPELSPAGRRQAAAVAEALAARGTVQAVVSSPPRRCRETAQAVADRLGLAVVVEDGLRETDFGAWEGLTFGEVRERFPDDLQAWLDSPKAAPTGGGESFSAVTRRVSAARDRLLAAYAGRTVLVVTHVTPVKTLVRLALGAPPESLFRMELSAASLSAVAYYADGNASVRLLNDTSHLR